MTTNSSEGYFENFLGDQGTLHISESANRGGVYREPTAPQWDEWVSLHYLDAPQKAGTQTETGAVLDVRETIAPDKHTLPVVFNDPYHKPHLENFFATLHGKEKLNCDARHAFESEAPIYWVNPAALNNEIIQLTEEHLSV